MSRRTGDGSEFERAIETSGKREEAVDRARRDLKTSNRMIRAIIAVATVLAVISVANAYRPRPATGLLLSAMVVALGALSYIDVAEQRLPNKITMPMAGVSAAVVLLAGIFQSRMMASLGAIALGVGFALVLLILRFGLGDVKLALSIGAVAGWLGTPAAVATVFVASTSGALAAGALMILHRNRSLSFGFGPFLALGSVAGMLAAAG